MRRHKYSKKRQLQYEKKKKPQIVLSLDVVAINEAARLFRKRLSQLVIGSAKGISDAIQERDAKLESFDLQSGGKDVLILTGYYSGSRGKVCALSESMKYATVQIPTKIRTLFAHNLRKIDVQFLEEENAPQV